MTNPSSPRQRPYPPPPYPTRSGYPVPPPRYPAAPVRFLALPPNTVAAQHQPPATPAEPESKPRNAFGMAALVLAAVGVALGLVPLTGFIAFLCGAAGMVFGFLGIARAGRGVADNPGISIAGTVLSTIALVLGIWGVMVSAQSAARLSRDLGALSSSGQQPVNPVARPTPLAPKPMLGQQLAGNGTYVVGTDIQPGSYRTAGRVDSGFPHCYWSRNLDASGEVDSIVANSTTDGPTTVTVKPTDGAFHTSGCQPWTKVN